MTLLLGTTDALYCVDERNFEDPDPVLEPGHVRGLARASGDVPGREGATGPGSDRGEGILAATDSGLYHSTDGRDWESVATPVEEVTAVVETARGTFVGTRPARVFRSDGDGWRELSAFTEFPGREEWVHGGGGPAQVRTFGWHPDAPHRLLVGVESAGLLATPDAGGTWVRRDAGLDHDVHHLRALSPERFVAATGGGVYRTDDAGRSWLRCDTHVDHFHRRYCRETLAHDGALYVGIAASGPFWDGDDGAAASILRSTDGGRTLTAESYPGEPAAFVVSWTTWQDRPAGGTNEGTVLVRDDDGWSVAGSVPVTDRARGAYGITAMLEL